MENSSNEYPTIQGRLSTLLLKPQMWNLYSTTTDRSHIEPNAAKVQACNLYSTVFKRNRRGLYTVDIPSVPGSSWTSLQMNANCTEKGQTVRVYKPQNQRIFPNKEQVRKRRAFSLTSLSTRRTDTQPALHWEAEHSRIPAAAGNPEDSNCRVDGPARNTHSWPVLPNRLAESEIWGLCLADIAKENQQTGISKGGRIYLQFWLELGREKILSFFSLLLLVVVTFYRKDETKSEKYVDR